METIIAEDNGTSPKEEVAFVIETTNTVTESVRVTINDVLTDIDSLTKQLASVQAQLDSKLALKEKLDGEAKKLPVR